MRKFASFMRVPVQGGKALTKAREAIYFRPIDAALAAVTKRKHSRRAARINPMSTAIQPTEQQRRRATTSAVLEFLQVRFDRGRPTPNFSAWRIQVRRPHIRASQAGWEI